MLIGWLFINKNVLLEVLAKVFETWDWICDSQIAKCFPHHYHSTCRVVVLKFRYQAVSYLSVGGFFKRGREKENSSSYPFTVKFEQEPAQVPALKLHCLLPFYLPYVEFSKEYKRSFGLCQILSVYKEAQNYFLGDFLVFLMPVSLCSGNRIYHLTGIKHKQVEWETTPE